ncbi:MAG: MBL fold metallo-hydrolase [Anaerolineae bacterium]
MQILPDVYMVNGYPYGQHQNSYVLRLGDAIVMVDSGDLEHPTFDLIVENCARWSIEIGKVTHLLLTHAHFDHASHAARLQREGAEVIGNAACAAALAVGDDRTVGYAVHGTFEPCEIDRVVGDGEILRIGGTSIRCLTAPGHADSCTVYEVRLRGERLWFVGDVILVGPESESVELGWSGSPDYDRATYVSSLRRLAHEARAYGGCDHLFPGHGPASIGGGTRLVEMAYTKAMMELR